MIITFVVSFLRSAIRMAVPLGLSAMGEGFLERSGVVNIGLEGLMLFGALSGVLATYYSGNPWIGLLAAILIGLLVAALEAGISIFFHADEVVTGISINLLGLGLTSYVYRAIFGTTSQAISVTTFKDFSIPVLSKIPILGPIFFNQPIPMYLTIVAGVILLFILNKTSWGLDIRASGEDPWVAEAEGANAYRIRFICMLVSGALAASGGAFIALYNLNLFFDNMIAGAGFIALAIVVVGRWNPLLILLMSLFFGVTQALGLALQASFGKGAPYYLLLMIPFILTMIILPFASGSKNAPAALSKGYKRGQGT
jgi:general nucleoside transport system permease protein